MRLHSNYDSKSFLLKLSILVLLNLAGWVTGSSQTFPKEISENNIKSYREELYLQTDRDWYIVREQVWLKVFKLDAFTQKPNNISKVVYIEMLNSSGFPVQQSKLFIDEKSGSTHFSLSDTLTSGNYLIRAYTNWMKNQDEKEFSFKTISIINPFQQPEKIKIPSNNFTIDSVLFYPEGGKLISGIESKVNFIAVDKTGRAQIINAAVVDEKKDTVCLVRVGNSGFGTFHIKPDSHKSYRLLYTNKNGGIQIFPLGRIEDPGILISHNDSNKVTPFSFIINKSTGLSSNENRYFIYVKTGGILQFVKKINLRKKTQLNLSRAEIPNGISQIIIFNQSGRQVANRWIYNEPDEGVIYKVGFDRSKYGPREKVKVTIAATDQENNPVETDLTLAVTKSCSVNENRINIKNRNKQLFSLRTGLRPDDLSDINGNLILNAKNDTGLNKTIEPGDIKPQYLPELEGKIISGTLRDYTTDQPLKDIDVVFSMVGKVAKCKFYRTDTSGNFYFNINETGMQQMVIQTLKSRMNDYYIDINPDFINSDPYFLPGPFYLDTSKLEELNNSIISMQIENIYQPYRQNNGTANEIPDTISFYGDPLNTIQIADYIELTSVREVIKEIVPYVYTRKKNGKLSFRLLSETYGIPFKDNPLVIVDGTPFNDMDQLLNLRSSEVERIEVLNQRYFLDGEVFEGILNFITNKGNLEGVDLDPSVFRQTYTCFQREDSFCFPDYNIDSLRTSPLPDFRNTLYWNPDLHTQKDGTVSFEFFTSDEKGDYTLSVEGISPDGKTGAIMKKLIIK